MSSHRSFTLSLRQSAAAVASALCSIHACAQEGPQGDAASSDQLNVVLGVGAVDVPKYPGSSGTRVRAIPVVSITYGRFFIGGTPGGGAPAGIGVNLLQDRHWKVGVGLGGGFSKIRKESDDPHLKGLGDVDQTPRAALFASYSDGWYSVDSAVSTDIGGNHEGTTLSLGLLGRYQATPRLTLMAGPGIEWASRQYTQTLFGVDAGQSARSGLPEYTARSGINSVNIGLGAQYAINRNWGLGARASIGTLMGDAKDSPITEKKRQDIFGVFTSYRF